MKIDLEKLRECLQYDADTGEFLRLKTTSSNAQVGSLAGYLNKRGYLQIQFGKRVYRSHRLAWLLTYGKWPDNDIDHIDGDSSNNRLCNLRDVTRSENLHNLQNTRTNNKSGYRGVSWGTEVQKWVAQIRLNNKRKHIGLYATPEEASTAYEAAKLVYHPTAPIRVVLAK